CSRADVVPSFFPSIAPRPRTPTLFPYTTLFRSALGDRLRRYEDVAQHQPRAQQIIIFAAGIWPVDCRREEGRQRLVLLECAVARSEEHTSELQSHLNLVCRLLLEKKK